jgi:hypothetical protein
MDAILKEVILKCVNRKKSNVISDNTQVIDTNLDEQAKQTVYTQFHPLQQIVLFVVRSATVATYLPQAHHLHHSHQPLEDKDLKTSVCRTLSRPPGLPRSRDLGIHLTCNPQGWILHGLHRRTNTCTEDPNIPFHSTYPPTTREMRKWIF